MTLKHDIQAISQAWQNELKKPHEFDLNSSRKQSVELRSMLNLKYASKDCIGIWTLRDNF